MRIRYPRIQNRQIRFALAGCGRISNSHFEAITQHKNRAELVAVCDVDTGALNEIQNKTGVTGYTQYTDLLAAGGFDCVILTTPSGLHPQQTIQAGFHVMTEKPMATRWKDGVAMVKACDDASVRLFVVKQNRRNAML